MRNIVILISGGGSNMRAMVERAKAEAWQQSLEAKVVAVISNRPDAAGLRYAEEQGIDTKVIDHKLYTNREDFDAALLQKIDAYQPSLVLLAGFMRILTPEFVAHYAGRMLNIHPSLLPAFQGLHTHQRALDAGCQFAGATVHEVTAVLDEGRIWAQAVVPILQDDDAKSLAARVLSQEHLIYPRAVKAFLENAHHER